MKNISFIVILFAILALPSVGLSYEGCYKCKDYEQFKPDGPTVFADCHDTYPACEQQYKLYMAGCYERCTPTKRYFRECIRYAEHTFKNCLRRVRRPRHSVHQ